MFECKETTDFLALVTSTFLGRSNALYWRVTNFKQLQDIFGH